jgi:hypothetical protein
MSSHRLKRTNERLVAREKGGNMQKPIQSSHKFHIFHLTLLLSGVRMGGEMETEMNFSILYNFFGTSHMEWKEGKKIETKVSVNRSVRK